MFTVKIVVVLVCSRSGSGSGSSTYRCFCCGGFAVVVIVNFYAATNLGELIKNNRVLKEE